MTKRVVIPPAVAVTVEGGLDVMVASDSARRLADLRGFSPVYQAIAAGAVHGLAELVIRTHEAHTIEIHGFRNETSEGLLISCIVEWIADVPHEKILLGLESKLSGLVDEIIIIQTPTPTIELCIWLTDERRYSRRLQPREA